MPNTTKTLLKEHQDISFIKKFTTKLYNDNEKYKAEYSKNKTGTRDPRTTRCELVRNVIFIGAPTGSKRCVDPWPLHQSGMFADVNLLVLILSRNDIVFSSVVFVWSLYLQQFGRNASSKKINLATVHSILLEEFHGDSHRWKNFRIKRPISF